MEQRRIVLINEHTIRQKVNLIRVIGRNTQGVKLLRLDDGSKISSVTKVINDSDEDNDEGSQEFDEDNNKGPEETKE